MRRIWVFGDSFSATNRRSNIEGWRIKYIKWKGYTTDVWPEVLNSRLKNKLINLSISATDNYTIFETIIDNIDKIEREDIVIIGWSSTLRFRLIDKSGNFNTIRPMQDKKKSTLEFSYEYNNISMNTINEILVNRDNALFEEEINRFIKMINLVNPGSRIIHWSPFESSQSNLNIHRIGILDSLETIDIETKGEISDYHYSEMGHLELGNYFYDLLN